MSESPYPIRPYRPEDLPRLQAITEQTFGPVSIDRNIEQVLGPFGQGDWRKRKVASVADDCRIQPDGVFVALAPPGPGAAGGQVVGYVTTRLNAVSRIGWI